MHDQSEANYQWFRQQLPKLIATDKGKHVLLHDEGTAGFFASSMDAIKAGMTQFGEGNFSVEFVDDRLEDLGFYSYVSSALNA